MNLATGTFTVPTNGIYSFSVTTLLLDSECGGLYNTCAQVHLRVNGVNIAASVTKTQYMTIPLSSKLKKGDQVNAWLYDGALNDNDYYYTTFNGILIEEDLIL